VAVRGTGSRSRGGLVAAVVALVAALALALAVTAFTEARTKNKAVGGGAGPTAGGPSTAAPTTAAPIPKVKLSLPSVVKGVQPWSKPVRIKVSNGTLLAVKATDDTGKVLDGTITGAAWASTGQVIPSRTYQLQTYVQGVDGVKAYHTLTAKTSAPATVVYTRVTLQTGQAVGVGFPLVVKFTEPVTDRAAVEKALQVQTSVPVVGAWHWFSDTEVHYRPEAYWPAHTQIDLHRNLDGIEVAPGVWGIADRDLTFTVGDAHISTVDVATQHMTVTVNGKFFADDPVSTGRPALPTLGGVHIVLEKFAVKEMKSSTLIPPIPEFLPNGAKNPAYYDEKELWSTRISNAGAFVHYQPGTLKQQGHAAASHGCVNTNLKAAEVFYNLSLPGDVVNVIHSVAPPNLTDPGMMDWNYTWAQWLAGSATGA
jgi:lipoprotein-anchoring transpeptidase ErfK/SrfK